MYTLYILYSTTRDRYHIGFTGDEMQERLRRHNSRHKGFTGKAAYWKVVYTEKFTQKNEATGREAEIKSWKNRKRIEQLIAGSKTT